MRSLAPGEMGVIQKHLDTCGECRGRLADVLGDLSLVALTAPQETLPAEARDRFMKRLRDQSTKKRGETMPRERTSSGNWFSGLGWAAAAAALLFAAYMGNTAHNLRQRLDASRYQIAQLSGQASRPQAILDVLTSRTAKRVALTEVKATRPTAHVVYDKAKGALIFVGSDLRPVQENKSYQLWVIPANGQAPIPAGLFRPDADGTASVVLPPLPAGVEAKAFGVTIENAEGSHTPTLPIVMSGQ